jgi:hypothetical protein
MAPPEHATTTVPSTPRWRPAALVLVGVFLAAALPLILLLGARGRPGEDQINYHEPAIRTFASQLPRPDLTDYLSATTPGYHLVLAAVDRAGASDSRALQIAGAGFSVLLLILLARSVSGLAEASWRESLAMCLPFACSPYLLQSGVWLLPDNAGWLLVLCCLALALREPYRPRLASVGVTLCVLVLVRQIHLWAAGAIWAAAWLAPGMEPPGGVRQLLTRIPERVRALLPVLGASLPAFALLGAFVWTWGGLTPPKFQQQYSSADFASYAFDLSLLGIGSVFFAGYLADPLADVMKRSRWQGVALGALAGGLAAVIPKTTYSMPGRFSGLWNAVNLFPTIAGRTSVLIVALSAFGGAMLVLWCRALPARRRWIFLGAWFGFATAQAFSAQLWERYNEPMVLMMLALMAAASRPTGDSPALTRRLLAPLRICGTGSLALLLAAVSAYTISRFGPASTYDIKKINPPAARPGPPPAP